MKRVIIIRGPAGVGKSTIARILFGKFKEKEKMAFIPVDVTNSVFIQNVLHDSNREERARITQENVESLMKNFLNEGYSLIVEGMFDRSFEGRRALVRLINICKNKKAKVNVVELESSLEYILHLVKKRASEEKGSDNNLERTKERYLRFTNSRHPGAIRINVENKSPEQAVKLIIKKL